MPISSVKYRINDLELRLPTDIPGLLRQSEIVKFNKIDDQKEYCFTIATFHYDSLGFPELSFCGNRPTQLSKEEWDTFIELIQTGYKYIKLNDEGYEKMQGDEDGVSEG